jgi:hypothetical protein
MAQRITEEFVRHHKVLVERTGNTRHNVRSALDRGPTLALSIRELDRIWSIIDSHRKHSKWRFIVQAHPAFRRAKDDYEARWKGAIVDLWDWDDTKAGREPLTVWLERKLAELADRPAEPKSPQDQDDDEWDFDPDKHSAANHFEGIALYIADKAKNELFFACRWRLEKTMGIDLCAMEQRWREFPVIVVSKKISDAHGYDDPQSLFAYLQNIRLAYVAGADLAAISMCAPRRRS